LEMAKQIAEQKLNYVYLGNIVTDRNTNCPNCDHLLIRRDYPLKVDIIDGKCPSCSYTIYGEF